MRPKALVLYGYGINCDYETQYAFERAGAVAVRVHINELIKGDHRLVEYQILALPGGFSFADDIGAPTSSNTILKSNCRSLLVMTNW